jgi:hypothetical protein
MDSEESGFEESFGANDVFVRFPGEVVTAISQRSFSRGNKP